VTSAAAAGSATAAPAAPTATPCAATGRRGRPNPNATHLARSGWSGAVVWLRRRCDHDCRVGWSAVPVTLSVMGPFEGKVAHLPFDHSRVATIPSFPVDFVGYFIKGKLVMIVMTGEGEKIPVSISWTG
jgi:hypothetical protein